MTPIGGSSPDRRLHFSTALIALTIHSLTKAAAFSIFIPRLRFPVGGSSKGRTADSDSASEGSNPSPPAKIPPHLPHHLPLTPKPSRLSEFWNSKVRTYRPGVEYPGGGGSRHREQPHETRVGGISGRREKSPAPTQLARLRARQNSSGFSGDWGVEVCATPWPRSAGCARG